MRHKNGRSRKYDKIRDEKMKVYRKCNENQLIQVHEDVEIHEDDEIHEKDVVQEEEEIGSSNDRNTLLGIVNLMDMDGELVFSQIPSKHMVFDNTIKKHYKNM